MFVLAPASDNLNYNLSGKVLLGVRVKNEMVSPLLNVLTGPKSQLLIVPVPVVLLKLTRMYDVCAPWCAPVGNAVFSVPWFQLEAPKGSLAFWRAQPLARSVSKLTKSSLIAWAAVELTETKDNKLPTKSVIAASRRAAWFQNRQVALFFIKIQYLPRSLTAIGSNAEHLR